MADMSLIVDGFGGPGGWSEGARLLGLRDIGIELEPFACATRAAAGHLTVRGDMTNYPPERFRGAWGAIFSPPCPDYSAAGKRAGRTGESGRLIDLVPEWVRIIEPQWIACEQTPLAIDIYREFAHTFRAWGYEAWTGILDAADYGVPQNRKRAVLLAAHWPVAPPAPTHARDPQPGFFGTLQPWVTMYEALGWGLTDRPAYTFCGGNEGGMDIAGGSGARAAIKRARAEGRWVVDRRTNSKGPGWRQGGEMVPTVTVPLNRPSPTLTGKAMGQWRIHEEGTPESWVKLTVADALTIQGFRPDYPVQGNKSDIGQQIGDAVPPPLAARVLSAVTGRAMEVAA